MAQWTNRKDVSMARGLRFFNAVAQWANRKGVSMARVLRFFNAAAQWVNRKGISMARVLRFGPLCAMGQSEGRFNGQGFAFWATVRNGPSEGRFNGQGFAFWAAAQWANQKDVSMARDVRSVARHLSFDRSHVLVVLRHLRTRLSTSQSGTKTQNAGH
jgi:hypothetical protein